MSTLRRHTYAAVMIMLALAMAKAALPGFRAKQDAIFNACRAERQTLGASATKDRYPTPEIHMVSGGCLMPGATSQVVVRGKFAPGTKFLFENDAIEVSNESLTGGEYRATVKAPAGIGPQTATLVAISPVTCITARNDRAIKIGGAFEFEMKAANGWKVVAQSAFAKGCEAQGGNDNVYNVLLYRNGETQPFEKRTARLSFSAYDSKNFRFSLEEPPPPSLSGVQEMQEIGMKLQDPSLSAAQRQQLMTQLMNMQRQMQANMAQLTNVENAKKMEQERQQARLEFGCASIALNESGGSVNGELRCSQRVGTQIALTGTVKPAAR